MCDPGCLPKTDSVPVVPIVQPVPPLHSVQGLAAVQSSRFKERSELAKSQELTQASPALLLALDFRGQESLGLSMLNYLVRL